MTGSCGRCLETGICVKGALKQLARGCHSRHSTPTNLPPFCGACMQLSAFSCLFYIVTMLASTTWPRLTSLHAAGLPAGLPRRALAARALATNGAVVQSILEGRSWLMPDPAVPVSAQRAVAAGGRRQAAGAWGAFKCGLHFSPPAAPSAPLLPQVTYVQPNSSSAGLTVIRDDLTHPLIGGNKWRKLDGLWPQLEQVWWPFQQGFYPTVLAVQG